ncbi:hypothetical protein F7725_002560 [Dissostichus mawsoni]|uniref:Uncharacterized protein n=1 Tax=Dissostichus mawsoni TaxID=36200 RepID=A0A7J5Y3V1_DISMA|nr:hypothetical protein F7725_002560 [Dissostichus mawsoni]
MIPQNHQFVHPLNLLWWMGFLIPMYLSREMAHRCMMEAVENRTSRFLFPESRSDWMRNLSFCTQTLLQS